MHDLFICCLHLFAIVCNGVILSFRFFPHVRSSNHLKKLRVISGSPQQPRHSEDIRLTKRSPPPRKVDEAMLATGALLVTNGSEAARQSWTQSKRCAKEAYRLQ